MASKNDVQRNPAQAVPSALKFAEKFAEFKDGDFLHFLAAEATKTAGLSQMVYPEEEAMKAKRLVSVRVGDMNLFEKFKNLLNEVEEYKSSMFEHDYQISAFLEIHKGWQNDEWNQKLLEEYRHAFDLFKSFWQRPNTIEKLIFLISPEMDGYFETSWKLFPYSLVSMFGNASTINKIVKFEEEVDKLQSLETVFEAKERAFLGRYWDSRGTETNPRVLCALALIVHRLAAKNRFNSNWTKVQFEARYFEGKKKIEDTTKAPLGKNGFYFWFMEKDDKKWRYCRATENNLLEYHKKTKEESESLVNMFRSADVVQ